MRCRRSGVAVRLVERARGNWIAALGDGGRSRALPSFSPPASTTCAGNAHGAAPSRSSASRCTVGCMPIRQRHSAMPSSCSCTMTATPGCSRSKLAPPISASSPPPHAYEVAAAGRRLAHLRGVAPTLELRLRDACLLWPRPASVARVPYGYLCADHVAADGLYLVGDQAAVILLHRRRDRDRVAERSPGGRRARGRRCGALCGHAAARPSGPAAPERADRGGDPATRCVAWGSASRPCRACPRCRPV